MARGRAKRLLVIGLLVLAVAIFIPVAGEFGDWLHRGKVKLPVGNKTPMICLGEKQGLILASDGSLWTWGSDMWGWPVLGLGSNTLKSTMLRRIGHDTNWVSISAGGYNSLAVKSDGTLWVWGRNLPGMTTVYMPVIAAPGNAWKQAVAGGVISAGLKKDGTLWAWGHNWCGAVGDGSTNDRTSPVQIGNATNWVKVRGGILETVGLQSDGSLWYWGENPDPAFAQGVNPITSPRRVSADTNWVDVGFGVNTVFAIKADGTLWTWGRYAERYTGATNTAQNATPTRIGTNSDWASISATDGWWITGLTKKDGSMWLMDASSGNNNSPPKPYRPVEFRRIDFGKDCVAYAGGSVHAAPPGVHGRVIVIVTREGEVWTSGMVMGDPPTTKSRFSAVVVKFVRLFQPGKKIQAIEPDPKYREQPWRLRNDGGE